MPVSHALTPTPHPEITINKLKRHWAQKENLTLTEQENGGLVIQFPAGRGQLTARDDVLESRLECDDEAALEQLEEVLKTHLERFAPRGESFVLEWQRE